MTTRMARAVQSVRQSRDAGQGALEYIGILAVVALVIGLALAAFTGAGGAINAGVTTLVNEVFTAGG